MSADADDPKLPSVKDLESVAHMVSNNVFFLQRRVGRSTKLGRWNTTALPEDAPSEQILPNAEAVPARKVKSKLKTLKDSKIPPSVRQTYSKLRNTDVYTAEAPVFTPDLDYQVGIVGDAWRRILEQITLNTITSSDDDKSVPQSIPPSFVEHEIEQLRRGRRSKASGKLMCDCSFGSQCAAFSLSGNNKPLHPYLTVSQQLDWDTTGTEVPGPCLLDIRRTITSVAMLHKHDSIGVDLHSKMPCMVPFYNTVDEAGGYCRQYCLVPSSVIFLPGPMVMYNTAHLRFVATATDATGVVEGYVDQGAMVYNPASLN